MTMEGEISALFSRLDILNANVHDKRSLAQRKKNVREAVAELEGVPAELRVRVLQKFFPLVYEAEHARLEREAMAAQLEKANQAAERSRAECDKATTLSEKLKRLVAAQEEDNGRLKGLTVKYEELLKFQSKDVQEYAEKYNNLKEQLDSILEGTKSVLDENGMLKEKLAAESARSQKVADVAEALLKDMDKTNQRSRTMEELNAAYKEKLAEAEANLEKSKETTQKLFDYIKALEAQNGELLLQAKKEMEGAMGVMRQLKDSREENADLRVQVGRMEALVRDALEERAKLSDQLTSAMDTMKAVPGLIEQLKTVTKQKERLEELCRAMQAQKRAGGAGAGAGSGEGTAPVDQGESESDAAPTTPTTEASAASA